MRDFGAKQANKYLNHYANSFEGDPAFRVHYWGIQPKHYDNPKHRHSFFEMCYVLDGEGSYVEPEGEYPLNKGTLFCSRPGVWHRILSAQGMYLLFVAYEVINGGEEFDRLQITRNFHISHADEEPSALLWRALLRQANEAAVPHDAHVLSTAYLLLSSFSRLFLDQSDISIELESDMTESNILKQAKLYIEDNLTQPISMSLLAGHLHISERHLGRLFSSEMRQTFTHYVLEKRIQKAKQLLDGTSMSLMDIAAETGFTSVHHFTRVFSDKLGIPPGKYRTGQFPSHPRKSGSE